jgi:hypothetical protein
MTAEIKRTENGNVEFDEKKYNQVCVWPGILIDEEQIWDFEKSFLDDFAVDAKFLEVIKTKPDINSDGQIQKETGNRSDVFFAIDLSSTPKSFYSIRLKMGIRWVEDVLEYWNLYDENPIYEERVKDYRNW